MRRAAGRITLRSALVLAGVVALARSAHAQESVTGRVVDPQGSAVSGIEVLLHAITESAGEEVDKDTTRADGQFTLTARPVNPQAVYFVAVMHEGQLYIGDLLRPPFQLEQEYVVRVGVDPVDLSPGALGPPAAPQSNGRERTAGFVVIAVSIIAVAAIVFFLLRARVPARRRWLVELARLEEELAGTQAPDDALMARRTALRNRLLDRDRD